MTKTKQKKIKLLKGEKLIYVFLIIMLIAAPVVSVFSKAMLTQSNIELEQVKKDLNSQTGINESLKMQINELASLDKVQEVAKELGLSYNDDNVKVITNE